jgi:ribosomal protein S18 acetylase RimI-like enzyme
MPPIIELNASDIPQLKSFVLEAWRLAGPSALGWTGATDENIEEIASESFLRGFVGNPDLKVFISKTKEKVVGFCAIRKIDNLSVELAGIVVRQDQLGKGIGKDLFEIAKKEAVKLGFSTMLVKTESANQRALSFYRSHGFAEKKHVVEELNSVKVDLTVLKLDL